MLAIFLSSSRKNIKLFLLKFGQRLKIICEILKIDVIKLQNAKMFDEFGVKFRIRSGAKVCKSCRSRQELSDEYLLAKFGAENEFLKVSQKLAES